MTYHIIYYNIAYVDKFAEHQNKINLSPFLQIKQNNYKGQFNQIKFNK